MHPRRCRGLIILLLDTLRADHSIEELPSFRRITARTRRLTKFLCGSFPTVPMRTDLLTGRLSFLTRQWALPAKTDELLTRTLRLAGVRSTLVTDNYVLAAPELGANLGRFFDDAIIIRGNGSDPCQAIADPTARDPARPSRSAEFELQYLTNVAAWKGCSPTTRLFHDATAALERVEKEPAFLLWVDSFAPHEPWIVPSDHIGGDEPFWPPYGPAGLFTTTQLARMRQRYVQRIADVDAAMTPFIDAVSAVAGSGDVALLLLSDHGFYFGEFGLIGKPKSAPLLPPLFDLAGFVSDHFDGLIDYNAPLQPHELSSTIARLFGAAWQTPVLHTAARLAGRNSDTVQTLTLVTDDEISIVFRDSTARQPLWAARDTLRPNEPWETQFTPRHLRAKAPAQPYATPWLAEFSALSPA